MRRALAVTSLLLVVATAVAAAATSGSAVAASPAAASGRAVPSSTASGRAVPGSKKPAAGVVPAQGKRVLEDVHIEGEIPVPQVLFITARDQRRFMDFRHRRYLRTSREFGERTVLPTWMVVTDGLPSDARKEKTP